MIGINATDEAPGSDGSDHDRYVLTLASVGAVLTAFSLPDDAPIIDLLQRAVTKIIDTGPY